MARADAFADDELRQFLFAAADGGGRNFRPVPGVRAPLFRSGYLGKLAGEHQGALGEVRTVVTLQTPKELALLGFEIAEIAPHSEWEHVPIGDRWFGEDDDLSTALGAMGDFYVRMVADHPEHWVRFFQIVADPARYPIVFHCTAGRDRTGVATALLLDLSGLDRAEILSDYLLSNDAFESEHAQADDVLSPLFAAIDERGGIEAFLMELGLDAADLAALRDRLASPAP